MEKRIFNLDLLRGVAIIWVVLSHLSFTILPKSFKVIFGPGWVGVDLFFVISGFVVTRSYLSFIANETDQLMKLRNRITVNILYLLRRFIRLQPIAWLWVLLPIIYSSYLKMKGYPNLFENFLAEGKAICLLFYNYYLAIYDQKLFMPYWSLIVEEHFYLLLMIIFCMSINKDKIRKILIFLFLILIVHRSYNVYFENVPNQFFLFFTQYRLDGLILGSILAMLSDDIRFKVTKTILKKLNFRCLFIFLLGIIYWIAFLMEKTSFHFAFGHTLLSFIILFLVLLSINEPKIEHENSVLNKIVNIIQKIGVRSYSIYLIHFTLILFLLEFKLRMGIFHQHQYLWFSTIVDLFVYTFLLFLIVELNFRFLESKLINLSRRIKTISLL